MGPKKQCINVCNNWACSSLQYHIVCITAALLHSQLRLVLGGENSFIFLKDTNFEIIRPRNPTPFFHGATLFWGGTCTMHTPCAPFAQL